MKQGSYSWSIWKWKVLVGQVTDFLFTGNTLTCKKSLLGIYYIKFRINAIAIFSLSFFVSLLFVTARDVLHLECSK